MENITEELKRLTEKIEKQNKESIFDKTIKLLEKVLLPAAVLFLSFQSIQLTDRLDSAQTKIADAALLETKAENERSEKESLRQLEMNYVDIIYKDLTSGTQKQIDNAINLIEILGYEFAVKFTQIAAKLDISDESKENLKTIAKEKISKQDKQKNQDSEVIIAQWISDKDSDKNSDETIKGNKQVTLLESQENDKINSRVETYSKNERVLKALSDKKYNGNKDDLKKTFWQLYYADMVKYENEKIESLMIKFGKELKSPTPNYEKLNSIVEEILKAMTEQTSSSNWVKEGYYRSYENFRISIVWPPDAKKKKATFKIKTIDNKVIEEKTLNESEKFSFNIDGLEYELILNSIGKAGKNPFTIASHYTIRNLN